MAKIYYDQDADLAGVIGRTVAIVGYGSQGHAHAQNLRDSGVDVVVGLHEGSRSAETARADGFEVLPVSEATERADVVMVLAPDHVQKALYDEHVAPKLRAGKTLMFAHGFNVRYGQIAPPDNVDVSLVAPKAPGHRVREVFLEGAGTPGLVAVEQNATGKALEHALAYAKAIGCTRAGVIETTFAEETETDLFGEQVVLCGGASALVRAGFEKLTAAGYQPEVAYFECLHELKLIVDLMYQGGLSYMWYSVSDTAEHGGYEAGNRIVDDHALAAMDGILDDIRSGEYAQRWILENEQGRPSFEGRRRAEHSHPIEVVGRKLRRMMPFLDAKEVAGAGAGEVEPKEEQTEQIAENV
ncbi:MAG TPA: ketol-acid reductoisomerase [Thermoanaerobaculia bacterium]|nr:ketol-acid reductoisomerase [Thermoanaerobaculia bacterium]